jgi:hypothetical protein
MILPYEAVEESQAKKNSHFRVIGVRSLMDALPACLEKVALKADLEILPNNPPKNGESSDWLVHERHAAV